MPHFDMSKPISIHRCPTSTCPNRFRHVDAPLRHVQIDFDTSMPHFDMSKSISTHRCPTSTCPNRFRYIDAPLRRSSGVKRHLVCKVGTIWRSSENSNGIPSFGPDILLLQRRVWGATWTYVLALVTMHIGAWATCVNLLGGVAMWNRPWKPILRILLLLVVASLVSSPLAWRARIGLLLVIAICSAYGVAFDRLRRRRIGSAAVGSFYDML